MGITSIELLSRDIVHYVGEQMGDEVVSRIQSSCRDGIVCVTLYGFDGRKLKEIHANDIVVNYV